MDHVGDLRVDGRWLLEQYNLNPDGLGRTTTLASRTEGSYETHFLTERSDLKRRPFAGASLCFLQRMEPRGLEPLTSSGHLWRG
jgi:hypothetical protein